MKFDPLVTDSPIAPSKKGSTSSKSSWLLQSTDLSPLLQTQSKHLPLWRILCFSALGFGIAMFQTIFLIVILPMKVAAVVPEKQKGTALGLCYAVCFSIIALLNPIAGYLSDRIMTRWGRRKPFMLVGTVIFAASNIALAFSNDYTMILVSLAITSIGYGANIYVSTVPEIGSSDQRAEVSSFFWVMTELGAFVSGLLGLFLNYLGEQIAFYVMAGVLLICLTITLISFPKEEITNLRSAVRSPAHVTPIRPQRSFQNFGNPLASPLLIEKESEESVNAKNNTNYLDSDKAEIIPVRPPTPISDPSSPELTENLSIRTQPKRIPTRPSSVTRFFQSASMRELLWPFKKMDFWLALGSTFLLSSLETIVQWFAYFYFRDIVSNYDIFGWVSLDNSETAVSVWTLVMTVGAIVGALLSNWGSGKLGHKVVVLLGAFFAVLAPTFYMFIDNFEVSLLLGFLFGGGVAWTNSGLMALMSSLVQQFNEERTFENVGLSSAKDMGLWSSSILLAKLSTPMLIGILLDRTKREIQYRVLFGVATACGFSGGVVCMFVRRPP